MCNRYLKTTVYNIYIYNIIIIFNWAMASMAMSAMSAPGKSPSRACQVSGHSNDRNLALGLLERAMG